MFLRIDKWLVTLGAALLMSGTALAAGPTDGASAEAGIEVVAQEAAIQLDVTVIHATKKQRAADGKLDKLGRYLTKSFKKYKGFKQLDKTSEKLELGKGGSLTLPNGKELSFRYDGTKKGFIQLYLEVDGLKTKVRVKDGGTFFQAGRGYKKGMIVLAFDAQTSK